MISRYCTYCDRRHAKSQPHLRELYLAKAIASKISVTIRNIASRPIIIPTINRFLRPPELTVTPSSGCLHPTGTSPDSSRRCSCNNRRPSRIVAHDTDLHSYHGKASLTSRRSLFSVTVKELRPSTSNARFCTLIVARAIVSDSRYSLRNSVAIRPYIWGRVISRSWVTDHELIRKATPRGSRRGCINVKR